MLAADNSSPAPEVGHALRFAVSPPLSELAKLPQAPHYGFHLAYPPRPVPKPAAGQVVDPVLQTSTLPSSNYSVGLSLLGVGNGFGNYSVPDAPTDVNIGIGDTQIVQWVNVSYAVFDKATGNTLAGPIEGNLLWSALGGPCAANNSGDIIAQWDRAAHRWLLSQPVFTGPPYYTCIAVSTSADALGTYYLYQYSQGNLFPDFPKIGVWSNGYYQTQNLFNGGSYLAPKVCGYDRSKLLVGDSSALQICFTLDAGDGGVVPADIDSPVPPPANEDEFFVTIWDTTHLSLYSMHADFVNPNNSSITGANGSQQLLVPSFTPACYFQGGGGFGGNCVPQQGVTDQLEVLGYNAEYRLAYYDDTPTANATATPPLPAPLQHMLVVHAAQVGSANTAPRWYELTASQHRVPVTAFGLFQSGTYAPDNNDRWMDSIARDKKHNILLGYSLSSSTLHPSIAVAGRILTDTLGTLEPELVLVNGTGSQTDTSNRWGDYTSMRLDPSDNCTFWYSNQYYMVTASFDWSTNLSSVKFSNCQ